MTPRWSTTFLRMCFFPRIFTDHLSRYFVPWLDLESNFGENQHDYCAEHHHTLFVHCLQQHSNKNPSNDRTFVACCFLLPLNLPSYVQWCPVVDSRYMRGFYLKAAQLVSTRDDFLRLGRRERILALSWRRARCARSEAWSLFRMVPQASGWGDDLNPSVGLGQISLPQILDGFWFLVVFVSNFSSEKWILLSGHRAGALMNFGCSGRGCRRSRWHSPRRMPRRSLPRNFAWHCRWIRLKVLRST